MRSCFQTNKCPVSYQIFANGRHWFCSYPHSWVHQLLYSHSDNFLPQLLISSVTHINMGLWILYAMDPLYNCFDVRIVQGWTGEGPFRLALCSRWSASVWNVSLFSGARAWSSSPCLLSASVLESVLSRGVSSSQEWRLGAGVPSRWPSRPQCRSDLCSVRYKRRRTNLRSCLTWLDFVLCCVSLSRSLPGINSYCCFLEWSSVFPSILCF